MIFLIIKSVIDSRLILSKERNQLNLQCEDIRLRFVIIRCLSKFRNGSKQIKVTDKQLGLRVQVQCAIPGLLYMLRPSEPRLNLLYLKLGSRTFLSIHKNCAIWKKQIKNYTLQSFKLENCIFFTLQINIARPIQVFGVFTIKREMGLSTQNSTPLI